MKQSTKKPAALFMSMCMAVSAVTFASVSSASAAQTDGTAAEVTTIAAEGTTAASAFAVDETKAAEDAVASDYYGDLEQNPDEVFLGRGVFFSEIQDGDNVSATFRAPGDMDVLFSVSAGGFGYAGIIVTDADSKVIASADIDMEYGDSAVSVKVANGKVYTVTLNYSGHVDEYAHFFVTAHRVVDIQPGAVFKTDDNNETYYRYASQNDAELIMRDSVSGERVEFSILNASMRSFFFPFVKKGEPYYLNFEYNGTVRLEENTDEIRLNETKEVVAKDYHTSFLFKPQKDVYARIYVVNETGAATTDEAIWGEVYCEGNTVRSYDSRKQIEYNDYEEFSERDMDRSFKAEAGKTYFFDFYNSDRGAFKVALEECAAYVIDDGVLVGDMTGEANCVVPSHYNPPYNPEKPDEYLNADAPGAREVTEIAYDSYTGNSKLVSVEMPNTVKKISASAFMWCVNLESAKLSDNLEEIGVRAFTACHKLRSISIPDSVRTLGEDSFGNCVELKYVKLSSRLEEISDYAFGGCATLDEIRIPASVRSIGDGAFGGCESLCKAIIPEGVQKIGENAFYACPMLTSVTIPKSVTEIGENAFGFSGSGNWDSQSEKWIFDKVEGFTIRGYKGTEAERYANANGFKFVELSGKTVQGDADGDGVIDSRDRVCLTRHLAKWAGYEDIDEKAADVNADGKVDTKDRIVLARHIAKWKGYESLPYKG